MRFRSAALYLKRFFSSVHTDMSHTLRAVSLAALLTTTLALPVHAQAPESLLPPAPGQFEGEPPAAVPGGFMMPDAPQSTYKDTEVKSRWFTIKPGLVLLGDYTWFSQDANSLAQVGRQDNEGQFRAARLMFRGTIGTDYVVRYLIAGEYKGFDSTRDTNWDMTDVSLTFPILGPTTTVTVGKTKETHSYEMVGDAANLAFQERVLNPFFVSRATGIRFNHVAADRMSTFAFGFFNDSWAGKNTGVPNDGTDFTARVTHLLRFENQGHTFTHLGASVRRAGADGGKLRYRGRPESNVTDYYVDTGSFTANHAWHVGLEGIWQDGPLSVMGEYIRAKADAPLSGSPSFQGGYIGASWVLSGDSRPYDPTVGYARRVTPGGTHGAIELVARLSFVDLDDGAIQGGRFKKTYVGANWWATHRWKVGMGWGRTWLDDQGVTGITDAILARIQWVY